MKLRREGPENMEVQTFVMYVYGATEASQSSFNTVMQSLSENTPTVCLRSKFYEWVSAS